MSRFLDQIRKAKQARESASREAQRKERNGGEENGLVPEVGQENAPSQPDIEPSGSLFPDELEDKQPPRKEPFSAAQEPEPQKENDEEELVEAVESDEPEMEATELRETDLFPDELTPDVPRKKTPPAPEQPGDEAPALEEEEAEPESIEVRPSDLVDEGDLDAVPADLAPETEADVDFSVPVEEVEEEEPEQEMQAESVKDDFSELEALEAGIDKIQQEASENDQEEPSVFETLEEEMKQPEEAEEPEQESTLEASVELLEEAEEEAPVAVGVGAETKETSRREGGSRRLPPSQMPREEKSHGDLFPSELEDDVEERPEPKRTGSAPVFFSDRRKAGAGTRRRGTLRGEIPVPGPEVDYNFVNRINKVQPKPDKRVLSYYDTKHHICEEYRLLGKNILHSFANNGENLRRGKVVVLSSSVRGEGKTLTSINLAMTLAQDLKERVLIVDADLRHPKVHYYAGLPPFSGLNDMLNSPEPETILEDCVQRMESGLHYLLVQPSRGNPAPLLDSKNMSRVLDILRDHYSLIIVDTPPVLLATDALTIGSRSDGMLFILRARKTQREQIQEARQRIARLDIRMLGYVINNVKSFLPKIWSRYYYGNY